MIEKQEHIHAFSNSKLLISHHDSQLAFQLFVNEPIRTYFKSFAYKELPSPLK